MVSQDTLVNWFWDGFELLWIDLIRYYFTYEIFDWRSSGCHETMVVVFTFLPNMLDVILLYL